MSLIAGLSVVNAPTVPPTDISARYTHCLQSLKELLILLDPSISSAPHHKEKCISKALAVYGRLRTWGEESRAALRAGSRGSLDDTLRKTYALKVMVDGILAKIQRQVKHATQTTRSIREERAGNPMGQPIRNADSDEDTEPSSDDSEQENDGKVSLGVSMLLRTIRHMAEDVGSLYQVSLLINRPGFNRRYVHSTKDFVWDPSVAFYANFDLCHVEDKVLSWRRRPIDGAQKTTAILQSMNDHETLHKFSSPLKVLVQRLARSNTRRREQLLHWSRHPDQPPAWTTISRPTQQVADTDLDTTKEKTRLGDHLIPPVDVTERIEEGGTPHSTFSKKTFSDVVVTDIFESQSVTAPARTIYAESSLGNKRSNRVPEVPHSAFRNDSFECPYCRLNLDSVHMRSRLEWKRHVFRDLRPYVCTFESCQNPEKQYTTRRDWIYHETQMHRRRWICEEHNSSFQSSPEFIEHTREFHSASVVEQQYPVLLAMSERACDQQEIESCPLCPDELQWKTLQGHLAEHLESIALFVLPGQFDEGASDDGGSSGAARGNLSSSMKESSASDNKDGARQFLEHPPSNLNNDNLMHCDQCENKWRTPILDVDCPDCASQLIRILEPRSGDINNLSSDDAMSQKQHVPDKPISADLSGACGPSSGQLLISLHDQLIRRLCTNCGHELRLRLVADSETFVSQVSHKSEEGRERELFTFQFLYYDHDTQYMRAICQPIVYQEGRRTWTPVVDRANLPTTTAPTSICAIDYSPRNDENPRFLIQCPTFEGANVTYRVTLEELQYRHLETSILLVDANDKYDFTLILAKSYLQLQSTPWLKGMLRKERNLLVAYTTHEYSGLSEIEVFLDLSITSDDHAEDPYTAGDLQMLPGFMLQCGYVEGAAELNAVVQWCLKKVQWNSEDFRQHVIRPLERWCAMWKIVPRPTPMRALPAY
ncbi:hypothetical protein K458DRAFT_488874 [Lentithecium fluviatile CBS 122367]|uniref:Oxidoreductase acuF-like C2H2 type zinc-finger domain-containing protein n=1 Tax=Lentithecium fluviatile CBS 122367 TaxID=1168545 RepID=A0A6G1IVA4_9PLEO|nr:hypothetical protein K458DRAFT_488874 [Lentithecium fluviatile CBS 122367]